MSKDTEELKTPISLKLRIGVSLGAGFVVLALALLQIYLPQVTINLTMDILIVIMFIPWIQPFVNKIDIPHGIIDLKGDINKLENEAKKSKLIVSSTKKLSRSIKTSELLLNFGKAKESVKGTDLYVLAHEYPELALAGLRIWMEKELKELLYSKGHNINKKDITSLGQTLHILRSLETINGKEYEVLTDLTRLLNRVIHSDITVDTDTAIRTLNLGYSIMQGLEERNKR